MRRVVGPERRAVGGPRLGAALVQAADDPHHDPAVGSPPEPGRRMGAVAARRYDGAVGRYFSRRCVGMHLTLLVLLPAFAWLTWWQLSRALGGNTLSWAYTFEWPLFAGYAVYMWWQLIHDQPAAVTRRVLPAADEPGSEGRPHASPVGPSTGGRKKNVAIAARSAVEEGCTGPRRALRRPDRRRRRPDWPRTTGTWPS